MSSQYTSTSERITKTLAPIRYVKLAEDMFKQEVTSAPHSTARTFKTVFENLTLSSGEYLDSGTNLGNLDPFSSDTTVLNFQVGTGKTQVLFDYIEHYLADGSNYTVFYCAPFLRLLSEITRELKERSILYFDCTKITSQADEDAFATQENFDCRIQLMTPDFLLSSGGRKWARQSANKTGYKDRLREHQQNERRKTILIIDEIHEKPAVFASQHMPELLQWYGQIHKTFIASATFTRDSIEVVKAVSFLTNRQISVFQADRVKSAKQARLHLHVCNQEYGEKDLNSLAGLAEVIKQNSGSPFHILTAYKSIAKKLSEGKGSAAAEVIGGLSPRIRLLTADSKLAFVESKSSIGTTFKTGVNIRSKNGVLIIILPGTKGDGLGSPKLGTFSDIRSSVIQAFARMRNGGNIHVFMPPLMSYIQGAGIQQILYNTYHLRDWAGADVRNAGTYESELIVFEDFRKLYEQRRDLLDAFKERVDPETRRAYDSLFEFEGFYDYLLSEYPKFKDATLDASGQGLSALILWMAFHEQFTNCSLETITVEEYTPSVVTLPKGKTWAETFSQKVDEHLPPLKPKSIFEAIEMVLELLNVDETTPGEILQYKLSAYGSRLKEGTIRELFVNSSSIAEAVFEVAEELMGAKRTPKKEHFMLLVTSAQSLGAALLPEAEGCYMAVQRKLLESTTEILATAKNVRGTHYLPIDYEDHLPATAAAQVKRLQKTLETVAMNDPLLKLGIVHMPGQSRQGQTPMTSEEYQKVAFRLVRQQLGFMKKRPSRFGSKAIFGAGTRYYKLD